MSTRELTHAACNTLFREVPEGQLFILTDSHTEGACLPIFADFIGEREYHLLTIEAGESNKNIGSLQVVWDFLLSRHATRQAMLINLGGGMISDLGGLAAATYMRGIRCINIPTTLLAMVDASTGGKTGIDYGGVKNVVGTFTTPLATLLYPKFLQTLPIGELLSGFAEMLKHALIASEEEWVRLLRLAQADLSHEELLDVLSSSDMLEASIAIKERVVSADPCESGWRKTLNFGHTIGHAIESSTLKANPKPHGYCVLWGMVAELYLSVVHMDCPRDVLQQLTQLMLQWYGRPQCNCKEREQLIQTMYQDKKNDANRTPNFTLLRAVGQPMINQYLSKEDIDEALEYLFSI